MSEETRTAIGVYQNRAFQPCSDVVQEFGSDFVVGLRESSACIVLSRGGMTACSQSLMTQFGQLGIHYIGSKGAARNINDLTAFLPKKTDHLTIGVDRNPIAKAVDFWTRADRRNDYFREFGDSAQRLFNLEAFQFQLMRVLNVLIIAAAASLVVRTRGFLAMGLGLQNGLGVGF